MEARYDIYEIPDLEQDGKENKLHARVITAGTVNSDEIARKIQLSSSLTIGDVNAVLSGLSHYVCDLLSQGRRVHIRGLGYFQMTLKCDIDQSEKKIRSESVHFKSVSFLAESSLKKELKKVRFIRTQRKRHSNKLSEEEIIKLLLEYFKDHSYISRLSFQRLCGFTQITAIRRINKLIEKGKLKKSGMVTHPVYEPIYEQLNELTCSTDK